jgi:hypothetical protein
VEQGYVANYFSKMSVEYKINWSMTPKLGLGAFGGYDRVQESGRDFVLASPPSGYGVGQANERISFYRLGIRSSYVLTKWANLNLGYEIQRRESNQNGNDFDRHLVTAGLSIRL